MRLIIGLALLSATTGTVAYAQSYIEEGAVAARSKKASSEVDYGVLVKEQIAADAARQPAPHAMEQALRDADNALANAERLSQFKRMVSEVTGLVPAAKMVEEHLDEQISTSMQRSIPRPIERVKVPDTSEEMAKGEDEPVIARSYEADISALLKEFEDEDYGK
ncbi:hypothetical protein [Erythrobacter aureus]|uniref:Uncharacterized protein n=1 Tax=Erythrobacter aureus TaxID=2182384 RepID=A0A345YJ48_9SPHN|nr:hypothetical protein [Erythrobacter aureus]AXK43950.1 hypothetical protein DVR09_15970 [Erythrobacter aureus]